MLDIIRMCILKYFVNKRSNFYLQILLFSFKVFKICYFYIENCSVCAFVCFLNVLYFFPCGFFQVTSLSLWSPLFKFLNFSILLYLTSSNLFGDFHKRGGRESSYARTFSFSFWST